MPTVNLTDVPRRLDNCSGALAEWATRDDTRAMPDAREAANVAMDAIDGMLVTLHAARSALIREMRASDDATNARVNALLAVPLDERLARREAEIRGGRR